MSARRVPLTPAIKLSLGLLIAFAVQAGASASAGPVLGFREDFTGTSTGTWAGGGGSGTTIANPGTGGTGGASDGFLLVSQSVSGNFGSRSLGAEYAGNWQAAGIELVRLSLNDVGNADGFEIHLCIGNTSNFWQYNVAFSPPNGTWQEFVVDLTDASKFTQIIGSGTFAQALQFADRILLRNDSPPYIQAPDPAQGDLGIDRIMLTAVATRSRWSTWGRIKQLYR